VRQQVCKQAGHAKVHVGSQGCARGKGGGGGEVQLW